MSDVRPEGLSCRTFTVSGVEDGFLLGSLHGGAKAVIPMSEVPESLRPAPGDKVTVVVVSDGDPKVASASSAALVVALFAGAVPEVRSGKVRIMAAARIPGVRTKVAVAATEEGVDPVSALIGRRACRVRDVAARLGGEKVEVVAWHPDVDVYTRNALSPAAPERVEVSDEAVEVWVRAHQAPVAIGEGGSNLHLVGELIGRPVELRVF